MDYGRLPGLPPDMTRTVVVGAPFRGAAARSWRCPARQTKLRAAAIRDNWFDIITLAVAAP